MNSEKKVTGYQIIVVGTPQSVNNFMSSVSKTVWREGWQPWGSPFVMGDKAYQAFVQYGN